MSSSDLDQVLLELIGRLPRTAKRNLITMANWMLSADCLLGGPYDGYPVVGKPELVEQSDYDDESIHVYKRFVDGELRYVGSRPCCHDFGCECLFGKVRCKHNSGETFDRYTPADRNPERAGEDSASRAEAAEMFREHDEWLRVLADAKPIGLDAPVDSIGGAL